MKTLVASILITFATAACLFGAVPTLQPADPSQPPKGLSGSDWSGIRGEYEKHRHAIVANPDGTHQARNPGQAWRTQFDGSGFTVTPDSGGWSWGLELVGHGNVLEVRKDGGKVSYLREDGVTEWFINDARGLEQGWTLAKRAERPERAEVGSGLCLQLAVRGTLRAQVSEMGDSIAFVNESGATTLTYGGLKAWDADGKTVDARFVGGAAGETSVAVVVDDSNATYPITIDPIAQQAYLKASNTWVGDHFGASVAVSGDTVVIGAPFEDSNATGVNGNQADDSSQHFNSGAAYVFTRSGTTWTQQAYLKPAAVGTSQEQDYFGQSVAISGDTVIVGAPFEASSTTGVNSAANENAIEAGAAYVFVRTGTTWSQQAYLKVSNSGPRDGFGVSVAVSGNTAVVGASAEDSSTTGVNSTPNENTLNSGAAYVFERSGTTWSQQAYLKASNTGEYDIFGRSVAVSGDTIVVGANHEDSSTTGVNGTPNESANSAGAAYVFVRNDGTWSQQAYIKASNTGAGDEFGVSVGISGNTVVVGALYEDSDTAGVNGMPNENAAYSGAAYVFERIGTTWSQQAYLKASNTGASDYFGRSVAVSGETVLVGANYEDSSTTGVNSTPNESASASGAAYVFRRSGTTWTQHAYLKASNTGQDDYFGNSVAVSVDTVIVGAQSEDNSAGAAYIFVIPPVPDIAVAQGSPLTDGAGSVDFGTISVGSSSVQVTFTITNTGAADLEGLAVTMDVPENAEFTLSALSAATIPVGGGSATFNVTFTPGSSGAKTAVLHIASNVYGSKNPFDIVLTGRGIVDPPIINNHPLPLHVTQAQPAAFVVAATGWNLTYQWKKAGVAIDGATATQFTIPAAQADDAGSYTVSVNNEGGSVTSDPAVLTVYVPSRFTQQPANATAVQGQSVTLTPLAEGSGTLTWQWRKDGVSIPGATVASYSIPNIQPWHSGNYSALISNGIDSATSADAVVKVSPFPFNVWQGLVAYYPLNATQPGRDYGPTGQDTSNQGTAVAGDSWGRLDGARRFVSAESDGRMTANGAFFHSQPNFTWTAWVKTSGIYSTPSTRILSTEGTDGSGQAGFGLYANSNGKFGTGLNWGGGAQGFESTATYPANVWRHLAATYDGSRLRLYVDGAQAGSRLYTGVMLTSDSPLYFGKYRTNPDGSTGGHFDGWLDDVRFYNRVLPAADLTQLRASDDGMDLDNDGLGDAWEARYGFSAAANEGSGDADGDGMTNRDEYLSGSSPVSAISNFHAPQLNELPGINVLNLSWSSSPGRTYAVQVSPDLVGWSTQAILTGQTGTTSFVVESPTRPVRHFYKIVVAP